MKLATLDAEYELECVRASEDPMLSHSLAAYKRGFQHRRDTVSSDLDLIAQEEDGVRDSLGLAFEDLKKFEHVAEITHLKQVANDKRIENALLDEVSLRTKRPA